MAGMALSKETLREIFATHFPTREPLDPVLADRIKRAMLEAAAAQRQADYDLAMSIRGQRQPKLVCGNCAQHVAERILGETPR